MCQGSDCLVYFKRYVHDEDSVSDNKRHLSDNESNIYVPCESLRHTISLQLDMLLLIFILYMKILPAPCSASLRCNYVKFLNNWSSKISRYDLLRSQRILETNIVSDTLSKGW